MDEKNIALIPYSDAVNALVKAGKDAAQNTAATAPTRNLALGGYANPEAVKNAFGVQPTAPGVQTENFLYNAFTRIKDLFKGEYDAQYNIPENASFMEKANAEWNSAEAALAANDLAATPYQAGVKANSGVGKRFDLSFMESAFQAAKEQGKVGPSVTFKVNKSSELADGGKGDPTAMATSAYARSTLAFARCIFVTLTGKEIKAAKSLKGHWRYKEDGESVRILLNGLPQTTITDIFAVMVTNAADWRVAMITKFTDFIKRFDKLVHVNDPKRACCYLFDNSQSGVSDLVAVSKSKVAGDSATSGSTLSPNSSATVQTVADAFLTYTKQHDGFTFLTGVQQWQ